MLCSISKKVEIIIKLILRRLNIYLESMKIILDILI